MNDKTLPNEQFFKGLIFYKREWLLLLLAFLLTFSLNTHAQTTGLIYKPATNGGDAVLDPNRDGYVSSSRAGFSTNDETESEIPYRRFPLLEAEPLGDLNTGAAGGHTDLAPVPLYAYFDGRNMMFRFRLDGQSTASKGYSVLIDTDSTLGGSGTNPGFEFEVLLASNFSVQVLDHRTAPSRVIFNGNVDQYHQRSIALTRANNDPDYFYDFYVPITAFGDGLTASTPLRMTGSTVTSAQSGLTGTISDVGGVNFASYNFNAGRAWQDVVSTFPPTSLNQIQSGPFPPVRSFCPFINSPIYAGATTVTGTTTEPAGTIIRIYSGSGTTAIGTTTTTAASWSVIVPALAPGTVITATAQAPNETESIRNCNPVTVTGDCIRPAAPSNTELTSNGKGFQGTSSLAVGTPISIYQVTDGGAGSSLYLSDTVTSTTEPNFVITISGTGKQKVPDGEYFARAVVNGCESNRSNYICVGQPESGAVSITAPVVAGTTSVSGTLTRTTTGNATIVLFADGLQIDTAIISSETSAWAVTLGQGVNLQRGQVITARAFEAGRCSSESASVTVNSVADAPSIVGNYCDTIRTVNGTSREPVGTTISVFATAPESTVEELVGTTTVNAYGSWSATLTQDVTTGSTLTARASNTALGILESPASNAVIVEPITSNSNLVVNSPIQEGDNTITGTYPTVGAVINVYIEGSLLVTQEPITVLSNGSWGVTGISPFETFAGARITATAQTGTNCESQQSPAVVVQCLPPAAQTNIAAVADGVCTGSPATIRVFRSERGVSYQLESKPNTTDPNITFEPTGTSVAGTGADIILTSAAIIQQTVFRVIATQVAGNACSTTLDQTTTVNAIPLPSQGSSVVEGPATICANSRANITITNTDQNLRYQLRIDTTLIGTPVPGPVGGGTLTLQTDPIIAPTTYNVFVTNPDIGCGVQFSPEISISPDGPSATQDVTVGNSALCINGSSSISVTTENNSNYIYQIFEQVDGGERTAVGTEFAGTGATVERTVGPFSTAGVRRYTVEVTNTTAGVACPVITLASQPTITVSNNPTVSKAGEAQILCDVSTATLQGNIPENGTGEWTLFSHSPNEPAHEVSIADPTSPTTTVSGLRQGFTYTFRWTITVTCGTTSNISSSLTSVKINCPSRYEVAPSKYIDEYQTGDVLATPSDVDGSIIGAELIEGTTIPPGILFNNVNGVITVESRFGLTPGTYSLRVRLTDNTGNVTELTVTITIYGTAPEAQPLPVDLVAFSATVVNSAVKLDWRTASELNNDYFLVQRSTDGRNFSTIGTVAGNGTSHQMQHYSYLDPTPNRGINYYRLVQVDYDGTETKSFIVAATIDGIDPRLIIFPNPVQDQLTIRRPNAPEEEVRITIQDLKGVTVEAFSLSAADAQYDLKIDISNLPGAVYLLTVESPTIQRQVFRIVKVN